MRCSPPLKLVERPAHQLKQWRWGGTWWRRHWYELQIIRVVRLASGKHAWAWDKLLVNLLSPKLNMTDRLDALPCRSNVQNERSIPTDGRRLSGLPKHKDVPRINGGSGTYRSGDTIYLNCTSGKSFPAAKLHWYINDEVVSKLTTKQK